MNSLRNLALTKQQININGAKTFGVKPYPIE